MIDRKLLLSDCQRLLKKLEKDIRQNIEEKADLRAALEGEHRRLREGKRTAATFESWVAEQVTQAAVSWILGCIFVRFLEDNHLVDEPFIAGPRKGADGVDQFERASRRRERYFGKHPSHSDLEYLQHVFEQVRGIPACRDLFAHDRNPLWKVSPSGDGAVALLAFWREIDPDTGELKRDLVAADVADTRFLGDLYQDLSEEARKRYALLQTPEFVEEFILDYTLNPALETFDLVDFRMIDPTCGSGHFLLGAFHRLLARWEQEKPGLPREEQVGRALASVHGIDINPFAIAITRFRLLAAALVACGRTRITDAPAFPLNLAAGDSLLLGRVQRELLDEGFEPDYLTPGEYQAANTILSRRYHAVVGNPPYIAVRDPAVRERVKKQYASCYGRWTLSVPFTERFFDLAVAGKDEQKAGCIGLINSNNFTKAEFGARLIERVLPRLDLTHVIDTSGAYIPGHGTPTVILFGRNQAPLKGTPVRAVLGIRGEPSRPEEPANGLVWAAIVGNLTRPGSTTEWLSVANMPRETFGKHPWSLGGGEVASLRDMILSGTNATVESLSEDIGPASFTALDDVFLLPNSAQHTLRIPSNLLRPIAVGEDIRDWSVRPSWVAIAPYDSETHEPLKVLTTSALSQFLWPRRSVIRGVISFGGKTRGEDGPPWWQWYRWIPERYRAPLRIAFAFIATHNHYILDRGGKVFTRTSPIIKLRAKATEEDHLHLIGLLNSSTMAFWLRQVCYQKGGDKMGDGGRVTPRAWEERLNYNASNLQEAPVPAIASADILGLARGLDDSGAKLVHAHPSCALPGGPLARTPLGVMRDTAAGLIRRMISQQEELDWLCYEAYGVLEAVNCPRWRGELEKLPPIELGQRAFEIVLARRIQAGEEDSTWFKRHRSTPITELPEHWPPEYRETVEQRIRLIEEHPYIRLLERPEHKRRWHQQPWDEMVNQALYDWLCNRLERDTYWPREPNLASCAQLADLARHDAHFVRVANLYRGTDAFDLQTLVQELVAAESVPYLPLLRYTESGLRKRKEWEHMWDLQRQEDAKTFVGEITVPPKCESEDFRDSDIWRHRGKLDVPKERFVSYPGAERSVDPSLVVTWAGYDHEQQAKALADYYVRVRDHEGFGPDQLAPLLAGLDQLQPWVQQWHGDGAMAQVLPTFIAEEARRLGKTIDEVRASAPPRTTGQRRPRGQKSRRASPSDGLQDHQANG